MALRTDWAILAQKRTAQVVRPVTAKGGYREDLGFYVRSKMEANVIRYAKWMQQLKVISSWAYESHEWEFPIKRGNRFYKSDLRVTYINGQEVFWEIKGYMDAASKTKLKRMAKYYPDVRIRIIDAKEYRMLARNKTLIPHWE
jgi:hypothetical protein